MKRKSVIIMLLLAFLVVLPVLAQAAPVGKFTSIEGSVDVTVPGKQAVTASLGGPLNAGDVIRTKSGSRCEVVFVDGSVLRLAERSRLRVTEFVLEEKGRRATLDLFRGKIQNIVKAIPGAAAGKSKYEVNTPTAVAGVRGTNFFSFFLRGVSGTVFKEGTGYGYSRNRPKEVMTIRKGHAMLVTDPNLPSMLRLATDLEMGQHEKDTAPSKTPKSKGEEKKKIEGESDIVETEEISRGAEPEPVQVITGEQATPLQPPPLPYIPPAPPEQHYEPPMPVPSPAPLPDSSMFGGSVFAADASNVGTLCGGAESSPNTGALAFVPSAALTPSVNTVSGDLTDGSSFAGYMTGVSGSYRGLMSSIYVNGTGAGYLSGSFADDPADPALFSGTWTSTGISASTTLVPAALGESMEPMGYVYSSWSEDIEIEEGYPLPIIGSRDAGGFINPDADFFEGELAGITTTNGTKLGVWGAQISGGSYSNASSLESWGALYGQSGYDASENKYYMLGDVAGTDDLAGHVTLNGSLDYMDTGYLGRIDLDYRGHYDNPGEGGYSYDAAGAGTYTLEPLAFGSAVGVLENNGFQYLNNGDFTSDDSTSGLTGLMGGTSDLWTASSAFTMMGKYDNPNSRTFWVMDMVSKDTYCPDGSCNIAGQPLSVTGTSFAGVGYHGVIMGNSRNDTMKGKGIALYIRPDEELNAGYLKLDAIDGSFYPGIGMWEATGSISAVSMGSTSILPENLYDGGVDLETSHFTAPIGDGAISGSLNGVFFELADQDWGVGAFGMAGDIAAISVPTGAWSARFGKGKAEGNPYDSAYYWYRNYMLGTVSGDAWDAGTSSFTASSTSREMNADAEGDHYLAVHSTSDITGMYGGGTYEGTGTFVETAEDVTPLTFVSAVDADILRWGAESWDNDGSMTGLMGGTGSLWTATQASPAAVYLLGDYTPAKPSAPYIFGSKTVSLAADGGAYQGYIGGGEQNGSIEGKTYSIYIGPSTALSAPNYPAGVLVGSFTGTAYPEIGIWEAEGDMVPVYLADVLTTPANLVNNVLTRGYDSATGSASFTLFDGSDYHTFADPSLYAFQGEFSLFEQGWGVRMHAAGGSYLDKPMTDNWAASFEYINDTSIVGEETIGSKWSENKIAGTSAGYGAFTDAAVTWISVGDVLGSFDPANWTFQMGTIGVGMETRTFLALQGGATTTETANASLMALNIPAVQVGTATLEGWGPLGGGEDPHILMDNVRFFATSTGNAPRIWATDTVSGEYVVPPTPGVTIPLEGGGLSANFTITNWGGAVNDPWAAKVTNGSGTMTDDVFGTYRSPIQFHGAAAGTINSLPSVAPGIFIGTAAGVAKPVPAP